MVFIFMPNKQTEKIIKDLNKILSEKFCFFKGSYLYGSRSTGNFNKDSDIDIINIFEKELTREESLELAGIIGDIDYKYDVFIDYHDYTFDQLKRNPVFYKEVVSKGFYYEAA